MIDLVCLPVELPALWDLLTPRREGLQAVLFAPAAHQVVEFVTWAALLAELCPKECRPG